MKKLTLIIWLTLLSGAVGAIFWYNDWKYNLPTVFFAAVIFFICRLLAHQLKKNCEAQILHRNEMARLQREAIYAQEMKALKESLEKEKYYLDSLMDNMPDAIYFKDSDSKLLRVSKYMADHFHTTVEDLIGKSDFDFQDEAHSREAYEDEQIIQRTRVPKIDYIEKELRKDGAEYWITTTKMPLINAKGEVVGTFGMSRDITKVKMLEAERHSAELDKAVAQGKFEIASDVMHDIGNAVVGFGSYLTRIRRVQEQDRMDNLMSLTRFFEENKPAMISAIGEAKAGAIIKMLAGIALTQRCNQEEVAKSITEQLNIITHIQEILNIQRQYIAGKGSKERQPVNLKHVINDSISMVFASIDKMAIGVSLEMPQDLPIIKGDRTKLMQAILNILKNSIEAIDKNSADKSITLNAFTKPGQLVIQIRDTGNGFDESTATQIFTRGFSTKFSGSGFGLYNCRSIIESHDGTIDIASEGPGKGSVTTIGFKLSA